MSQLTDAARAVVDKSIRAAINNVCCIYPTVGAAMYDEPRERLVGRIMAAIAAQGDDSEPVTRQWLKSEGFDESSGFRLHEKYMVLKNAWFIFDGREGGWSKSRFIMDGIGELPAVKTRGDLRALIRLLGEPKASKWQDDDSPQSETTFGVCTNPPNLLGHPKGE